jgi:hypothetical protein
MTTIDQSQSRKAAHLSRRSSTSHDDARPNGAPVHQIYPRSTPSAPLVDHQTEQLRRSIANHHRTRSHQAQSVTPSATVKSP